MSSVVIRSDDESLIRRSMDEYAVRLLSAHPEIAEIIVFGSFMEGTCAPGSDLDVLLVLDRADRPVRDRIPLRCRGGEAKPLALPPQASDILRQVTS